MIPIKSKSRGLKTPRIKYNEVGIPTIPDNNPNAWKVPLNQSFILEPKSTESNHKNNITPICGTKSAPTLNTTELKTYPFITPNSVEFFLNIKTISEANCQEHWTKRHRRHKKQKTILFWSFMEIKPFVRLPCTITFVRLAPKMLDKHDNLPMSMKWLCDQLCAEITGDQRAGRADDSDKIKIKYDQIKSKVYAVKIIIEF